MPGPPAGLPDGGNATSAPTSYGGYFASVNRNKRSVCLDLKDPSGRQALLELLSTADVLTHHRPTRPQRHQPEEECRGGTDH